jgi:hypothetical protein
MWGRSTPPPPPPPPPPSSRLNPDARPSLAARSAALDAAARGDPHAHEREERAAALRLEGLEDVGEEGAEEEDEEGADSGAALFDAEDVGAGDVEQGRSAAAAATADGLLLSPAAGAKTSRRSLRRRRHFARYQRQMLGGGGGGGGGGKGGGDGGGGGAPPPDTDNNDPDAAAEQAFRAALKRHHASDAHEAVLARVQFRRLAAAWLRDSGWGRRLMIFDCLLSIASVGLYIASTYAVPVGKASPSEASSGAADVSADPVARAFLFADLALAVFFALHWMLRLWISEERLPFVFSFGSLIDLLTTVPTFVSVILATAAFRSGSGDTVPAFAFLRVFRVLRVVRLFTITRADSPSALASEVSRAAALLGFTFVTFIVLAATLFYEIERRDPESENKDITFGEALYWGCVTLTTVGYGDISPNTALTQALTVVMLGKS